MVVDRKKIALELLKAEKERKAIPPLTKKYPNITVDDAYAIQLEQVSHKLTLNHKVVGKKIGLTSKAMQDLFGVNEPDYGHLFDNMFEIDGSEIYLSELLQPKIEFEIAFHLKKDLQGPHITALDVIQATEYITPAFEIIDSRIKDWKIRFEDTVADNGSSAKVVLGQRAIRIQDVDITNIGMVVYRNGKILDTASSAAVMGNPALAIAWLANSLYKYGISLKKDEIILSGALTKAVEIHAGDEFTAEFSQLGSVSVSFI